ncbi:MAG TPA: hypothetical protein VF952_03165 [Chloroflexia bacterium]|jgi:hypothetical protein
MRTRVRYSINAAFSVILLLGLFGCATKPGEGEVVNNGSASGQQSQVVASFTQTATPNRLLPAVTRGPGNEIAPPYFEIRQRTREIVNPEDPDAGPIVNDDGIVDANIRQALADYQASLAGRRIDRWEGWVLNYTSTDFDNPETNYNIGITMQEPGPGKDVQSHVFAFDYPRERVKQLAIWEEIEQDPGKGFGSCRETWNCQHIILSGILAGLQADGLVYIEDMTFDVVK